MWRNELREFRICFYKPVMIVKKLKAGLWSYTGFRNAHIAERRRVKSPYISCNSFKAADQSDPPDRFHSLRELAQVKEVSYSSLAGFRLTPLSIFDA